MNILLTKRALIGAKTQDYGQMAVIFERVINVIDHFDTYIHIEQIANLSSRVKTIKNELITKVKKDFEDSFSNPFTKVMPIYKHKIKIVF
jgi:hypothetical protein